MHRFALLGCGAVGSLHAETISSNGKLMAVCDVLPERTESFADQYGASAYSSLEELLAKEASIDTVVICTPTGLHAEHAIKILQSGRNVLCELPLCLTTAGAWQIMETEKYCRRKLVMASNIRHYDRNRNLKTELFKPRKSRVKKFHLSASILRPAHYYDGWRGKTFPAGGMLYTELAGYLELAVFLFGRVTHVTASASNMAHPGMEVEDWGSAVMETENGIAGLVEWSVNRPGEQPGIRFTIQFEDEKLMLGEEHFRQDYDSIYKSFGDALAASAISQVYDAWITVEAIEKIYKAASLNPS